MYILKNIILRFPESGVRASFCSRPLNFHPSVILSYFLRCREENSPGAAHSFCFHLSDKAATLHSAFMVLLEQTGQWGESHPADHTGSEPQAMLCLSDFSMDRFCAVWNQEHTDIRSRVRRYSAPCALFIPYCLFIGCPLQSPPFTTPPLHSSVSLHRQYSQTVGHYHIVGLNL